MTPLLTELFFWTLATPIILFPIVYWILAPWWKSAAGRQTMTMSLALLALVGLGIVRRIIGADYVGSGIVMAAVQGLVGIAVWGRLYLLLRIQFVERRRLRKAGRE